MYYVRAQQRSFQVDAEPQFIMGQELALLLLFFHCSRTLLRSNTPPLKQIQKMNAEEIILSKHVNFCSVTRHLGSSLVPEQSQRQHVHSQNLSF